MTTTTRNIAGALLATLALSFTASAALAQDNMKSDGIKADSMSKPMSKHDMKMMKSCQGMDHDKMMANTGCKKMMKMHPDMMPADGMTKTGGMMTH